MHNIDGNDMLAVKLNENFAEHAASIAAAQADATLALSAGTPFHAVAKLVSTTAGTAVSFGLTVPAGKKVYLSTFRASVYGSTAWTGGTGTLVNIQDTNGTPVVGFRINAAGLTANAVIDSFGDTNVDAFIAVLQNTGFTAAKGLVLKGDNNFGEGSDLYVTISGYIK